MKNLTMVWPDVLLETDSGKRIYFDSDTLELFEVEDDASLGWTHPAACRIVLTEKCNLGCLECFATKGKDCLATMSEETLVRTLEWSFEKLQSRTPVYHFFGGEPLLKFDLIRKAVMMIDEYYAKYRREMSPIYAITTNATLVNPEVINFFRERNFKVGVSVDGPREVHNELRPMWDGSDSYEKVVKNYWKMYDAGVEVHILITPNRKYLDRLVQFTMSILEELPMQTITINTPFRYDTLEWNLDGRDYAHDLIEIWRIAKAKGVTVDCALTPVLAAISNATRRATPCSVTGENFMPAASPDGTISYCAQKWSAELALRDDLRNNHAEKCLSCYALGYCGGVCPAFRALSGKEVDTEKCAFMRAILPLVIDNLDLFMEQDEGGETENDIADE